MAKTTPSKEKKKKDKSVKKKKKRKLDDTATTPKKKKVKVEKDSTAKKKKKKKVTKEGTAETPKEKKKKKKVKKEKTPDAAEATPSGKKKKRKAKDADATSSGKKKKGKKVKSAKKKKKVKKKTEVKEEEEVAAPAVEVKVEETEAAPAEAEAPAAEAAAPDTVDDGATEKLFVGNLSFDIDEAGIKEFFKDCGTITDVFWLESKEDGRFMGKGFITFENVDQARKAFAKKDEELMGRPILVDYAQPRKKSGGQREPRPLSERPEGCTTVFLGNLDFNIEEDDVKNFAKDCGEIRSIRWLTHRDTGDFKGCGFCEFTTSEAVDKFVKLNGKQLKGRAIRIDYAQSKKSGGGGGGGKREPRPLSEKPEGCTTVFCGNLSFDIDESKIHELAKECGEISKIRWLTDRETQEFKGCGFVEFYDTESVDKFVLLNGKDVMGRSIRIDYAKPRPPRE